MILIVPDSPIKARDDDFLCFSNPMFRHLSSWGDPTHICLGGSASGHSAEKRGGCPDKPTAQGILFLLTHAPLDRLALARAFSRCWGSYTSHMVPLKGSMAPGVHVPMPPVKIYLGSGSKGILIAFGQPPSQSTWEDSLAMFANKLNQCFSTFQCIRPMPLDGID